MQFSTIFVAILPIFAGVQAQAGPSARGIDSRAVQVQDNMISISLCSTIAKCVAALAPTVVACGAALVEEGLNPIADAACIAAAVNAGVNTPDACKGCF
ncbi:hypothetical protein GQ53DRAFT_743356 [Thozetella sp. PMI_491]|nr:hypothetical protein GQ53DRAFT_743356 [Thozetella sp. PMI_491]